MSMCHPAFDVLRVTPLPALDLTVQEFRHRVTGARHVHLAADNPENVFLVAFKTMPEDSTGVAHILEHTVLCGSERFPVRDPFFLMIRRSLNTFMNAFTASDWTAYPFASTNTQDFDHLLRVYLDAVFFPHLHPLDFAQEGIRIEPEDGRLVYKGVVYNEMKGAMSAAHSVLHERLNHHLFPTTTYHHNSGGDPAHIPDLTHEALKAFHARHYHPSNAVFMTFGNILAHEHQARFETLALHRFTDVALPVSGRDEKRFVAPVRVEEAYAPDSAEGPQTHHVLGWLLGASSDALARAEAHLLTGILLEDSASPLRAALETTTLGTAPSPLMGLDDQGREMSFLCGLEGSTPEQAAAFEQLVWDTLTQVAEEGVPASAVEAVLHQFELAQREIGGDSYPYGLQLVLNGLNAVLQDADPLPLWDITPQLETLRARVQDPDYVRQLVRRCLLDNPHYVRLTLRPDASVPARREALEAAQLAAIQARIGPEGVAALHAQAEALATRQAQEDDVSCLPKVTLADVPRQVRVMTGVSTAGALPVTRYEQGTNGVVYHQLIVDVPDLSPRAQSLLPLYTALVSELGAGAADYRQMQQRQTAVSGGLRMAASARVAVNDAEAAQAHLVFSGKALARHQTAFMALMAETWQTVRFTEGGRVRELLAQMKARAESGVTGRGHQLAAAAASRQHSALARFQATQGGLFGIQALKQQVAAVADDDALAALLADLAALHAQMQSAPRQLLLIGEAEALQHAPVDAVWGQLPAATPSSLHWPSAADAPVAEAWLAATQVQFCSRAYATVPPGHPDAPALMALGGFLRNGYLHRAIREQGGAYGGGAGYDANSCSFRFFSYRDPRFTETLQDFDASLSWLHDHTHQPAQLEEALLGLLADADKPLSPAGEARQAFYHELYGRTPAVRQQLRERLLSVTRDDLQRVAHTYLQPERAATAVIVPFHKEAEAQQLGLQVRSL